MGLGIELLFNMRTNSGMFEDGIRKASTAAEKFYKGFGTNLNDIQGKLNIEGATISSFNNILKKATPIAADWAKALSGENGNTSLGKGDEFVMSRTLDGVADKVKSLQDSFQNFFGQSLGSKKFQQLQGHLMDMGATNFSNLVNSTEKFTKNLDRFSPKQQKLYVDLLEKLRNAKTAKEAENLTKQLKKISDLPMQDVADGIKNMGRSTLGWLKLGLELGSLYQIFIQVLGVQNDLARSTWQMGKVSDKVYTAMGENADKASSILRKGVRDQTATFMNMNRDIATSTQSSLREVGATMSELMKMRVGNLKGDFKELANTSMLMQKGLGMSSSVANQFVHDLSLIGGLGADDVKAAAQEISNVQQNLGLTESEAQLVGATVGKLMRRFKTFGGSAKDVQVVTKEVSKMTAAFASVGLAADDAQQIVMDMMNPDNLQKSVLMWSSMGMTAADGFAMMHGEGKNMEGMTEKMVSVAKNLKTQYGGNIFALKAMAEAHGMNLEQVQALSEYNAANLKDMKKQAALEEAAMAARQGLSDQWLRFKDQLMVILQAVLLPILKILGDILEPIINAVAWINKLADSGEGLGKIFGHLLRGVIIVSLLTIMGIIPGITSLIHGAALAAGGIGGKLAGAKDALLGLGSAAKSGAKTFAESWSKGTDAGMSKISKLKSSLTNVFKKGDKNIIDVGGNATKNISKGTNDIVKSTKGADKGATGLEKIGKALKKFPDKKKILAIGGALLLIAAGVSMVIMSIALLVKAVGDAQLGFSQLAGIAIVLLPVFGGFIGMLWGLSVVIPVLGAAGSVGAIGILAIGGAMLMMGAGIALIVLSISKLVDSFGVLGDNAGGVASAVIQVVASITQLVLAGTLLAVALGYMSAGFIGASVGVGLFLGSMLLLMTTVPMLMILSLTATKVGEAILNMGIGAQLMANNFGIAASNLALFKSELGGGWKKLVDQVIQEIERMNMALEDSQKLTLGTMAAVVTHMIAGKTSGEGDSKNGAKSVDYTSSLNIANEHLNKISNNTAQTNKLLGVLINETKKSGKIRTSVKLTANMGA